MQEHLAAKNTVAVMQPEYVLIKTKIQEAACRDRHSGRLRTLTFDVHMSC